MERDCLIAYGASMLIFERLMLSADPFKAQVFTRQPFFFPPSSFLVFLL